MIEPEAATPAAARNRAVREQRAQLTRQVAHWTRAASELADLTQIASHDAWQALERYLGARIRASLQDCVTRLARQGAVLSAQLGAAETSSEVRQLAAHVASFRHRYFAVEAILDFYGDAINSRTSRRLAEHLCACDTLAARSMSALLGPLGHKTPPVLTYVDKGLGASILKADFRLWDGRSVSPVAAIKIVRHNLQRPTALIHEAGHQVAHITGWNGELASALGVTLAPRSNALASLWSGWASEVAADAFAFAHTGYAALAALHDVLSNDTVFVTSITPGDPHPASYIRVLLGKEMCSRFFGAGPWDALARAWIAVHALDGSESAALLRASRDALPVIVEAIFDRPYRAFGGKSLAERLDPTRVRPDALHDLEQRAGRALHQSSHWLENECLRLLALSGYRTATEPEGARAILEQQDAWMRRLGSLTLPTL